MNQKPILVAGMGFGDEGKGNCVASYAYSALLKGLRTVVVRYNGGAQAAHNVVSLAGEHHTFSQITSNQLLGKGNSGLISSFMLFNPWNYLSERDRFTRTTGSAPEMYIGPQTPIITPYHVIANRITNKMAGGGGTCGQGIGELMSDLQSLARQEGPDVLRAERLLTMGEGQLVEALRYWQERKHCELIEVFGLSALRESHDSTKHDQESAWDLFQLLQDNSHPHSSVDLLQREDLPIMVHEDQFIFEAATDADVCVIFEGAQGVLLDEYVGFHPYTTWSDTTFNNADTLLEEAGIRGSYKVGVIRAYSTRHGDGPFHTSTDNWFPDDKENTANPYQGAWRTGPFNVPLARYAFSEVPCDGVFVTHTDVIVGRDNWVELSSYDPLTNQLWTWSRTYNPQDRRRAYQDQRFEQEILRACEMRTEWVSTAIPSFRETKLPFSTNDNTVAALVSSRIGVPLAGLARDKCFAYSEIWSTGQ